MRMLYKTLTFHTNFYYFILLYHFDVIYIIYVVVVTVLDIVEL